MQEFSNTERQVEMSEQSKYCPDCDRVWPGSEFYVSPANVDGLSAYCKVHVRERSTQSMKRVRERKKQERIFGKVDDGYIERHEQKRQEEAEAEASYLSGTQRPSPVIESGLLLISEPENSCPCTNPFLRLASEKHIQVHLKRF